MAQTTGSTKEDLVHLQQVWENLAKEDPLWAISSWPSKRGRKWNLEEFFATGEDEVRKLFNMLDARGVAVPRTAALDFGCGVGRVTQALSRRFARVCGVDISPTMIAMAEELNQSPDRCRYILNATDGLRQIADSSFSFIYSIVVLQHSPPEFARRYIAEFGRIAEPGGLVMFQLTSAVANEAGLDPEAWVASLECQKEPPLYECGNRYLLTVMVRNASNAVWHFAERQPVMLGNHWLHPNFEVLRLNDGRTILPNDLAPGQAVELSLEVNTPPHPGAYVLELDLVQEGVSWFKDKGSPTAQIPVEVVPPAQIDPASAVRAGAPLDAAGERPQSKAASAGFESFSMHCIPREEVLGILADAGLQLEFIIDSGHAGAGYQSYFYVARRG